MKPLDVQELKRIVLPLRGKRVPLFSLACATRLMRLYRGFPDSPVGPQGKKLTEVLMWGWQNCDSDISPEDPAHSQLLRDLELELPSSETIESLETLLIGDVVETLISVTKSLLFQDPVDALHCGINSQNAVVRYLESRFVFANDRGTKFSAEVAQHELIRIECNRQERDILDLVQSDDKGMRSLIESFRRRAESEAAIPESLLV